ncbi:isopentenyl-diphosphate Delta-isomerase [Wenyingzhuangia sp. 2_MG-2023]|uniref:isopentenyl-diphosphate Delta-isomerase n=1 Tax=Wenyingzhuangia sp. 2_MG-2023 TaxID=3062639 RepID=UPI0026E4836E|nr:isopentenyl-diphosphate Delta-isomerase [Wenyingzhuangia sp. 2_MG-2023]MDO6738596.1 isopentenyl-diphosphate Delta-isomerase [Wenyingzhuangia sp. 2_MG-2023]MDO6802872.1 isopentenyl-diphosphate Delta-isomerase [Wenyingzhuangia sp. 1_MG-2023]
MDQVILVNEQDEPIGTMEKIEAHEKALLHRAFSVFIFNDAGELMLQQRAKDKYHSPLLWTNTCCSHQKVGESNVAAGKRRLQEEMGFTAELKDVCSFIYKAPFDNGLTEHEFDHVLTGVFNDEPKLNPDEAEAYKWMPLEEVKIDVKKNPEIYTAWFVIIFEKFYDFIKQNE